jgi:FtsH-binding integral membrane protein
MVAGANEVSPTVYNLTIGAVLFYGFVVDALIVMLAGTRLASSFYGSSGVSAIIGCIVYLICGVIGSLLVTKSDNPVVSFVGFNFFSIPFGVCLALVLPFYSSTAIASALFLTALITAVMMVLGTIFPQTFASMGRALCVSLMVCLVVDLIAFFVWRGDSMFMNYIMTFIFTLFIGYDWARANACAKTLDNAVDSAAELYLDIINVFLRILRIVGRAND